MTIAELIEKLKKFPQDSRVVVRGYEGGVDDVTSIDDIKILLNYNKDAWYYGDHKPFYEYMKYKEYQEYEKVPAIYLS